jgi:hypothetical protein
MQSREVQKEGGVEGHREREEEVGGGRRGDEKECAFVLQACAVSTGSRQGLGLYSLGFRVLWFGV